MITTHPAETRINPSRDPKVSRSFKSSPLFSFSFEGIEKWVTGAWKSKNELTQKYAQTMRGWGQKIQIRFTKVPAHSKVKYNELADETAKLGVANGNGIPKVKSLSDFEAADAAERMQDAAE